MIPRYDPTFQFSDVLKAFYKSGSTSAKDDLCAQLKKLYGVKYVFTFESARIALFVLLKAYDRHGGVLMPAYTCIVVPEAVQIAGYYPNFADINSQSLNVTQETLTKSFSPNTTVIIATHLFGIPCDIDDIVKFGRENNLLVVEDAAPAIGAVYKKKLVGIFGDAAIISFQATKVISSEDGGALLTNNDELAEKINNFLPRAVLPENRGILLIKAVARKMVFNPRIYPFTQWAYRLMRRETMYEVVHPETHDEGTFLKRCSPFSSFLVSIQMDRLEWNLGRRRRLAQIYREKLTGNPEIDLPSIVEDSNPSWIQFPIVVKDKRHFYRYMQKHGIDMSWTYKYSCADSFKLDGFPEAQQAAKTVLGLPTFPSLTDDQAKYICSVAGGYSTKFQL